VEIESTSVEVCRKETESFRTIISSDYRTIEPLDYWASPYTVSPTIYSGWSMSMNTSSQQRIMKMCLM